MEKKLEIPNYLHMRKCYFCLKPIFCFIKKSLAYKSTGTQVWISFRRLSDNFRLFEEFQYHFQAPTAVSHHPGSYVLYSLQRKKVSRGGGKKKKRRKMWWILRDIQLKHCIRTSNKITAYCILKFSFPDASRYTYQLQPREYQAPLVFQWSQGNNASLVAGDTDLPRLLLQCWLAAFWLPVQPSVSIWNKLHIFSSSCT